MLDNLVGHLKQSHVTDKSKARSNSDDISNPNRSVQIRPSSPNCITNHPFTPRSKLYFQEATLRSTQLLPCSNHVSIEMEGDVPSNDFFLKSKAWHK